MTVHLEHLPLLPDAQRAWEQLLAAGVDVDQYFAGWSPMLWRLLNEVNDLAPDAVLTGKEKAGYPRFLAYHNQPVSQQVRDETERLTRLAEADAGVVCQHCSRTPAYRRTDPLVTVACDGCLPLLTAAWEERHAPVS